MFIRLIFIIFARNYRNIISDNYTIVNYDSDNGWSSFIDKLSKAPKITQEVKDALLKLPKVNMDVITSSKELGNVIGYTNEDFYQFAKTANMSGDLFEQYTSHLQSASKQTTAFAQGMSVLKSIGGTLLSTFANVAAMYAVSRAIEFVYNTIHAAEVAVKKMEKSNADYKEAQSEVENINSQLDETASKIDELNAKENLSFTDKKELENLQAVTKELENQKRIAEEIELNKGEKTAKDTIDAFNEEYKNGKGIIVQDKIDEYINNALTTGNNLILSSDTNNLNALMAALEQYKKMKQEALNAGDEEESFRIQSDWINGIESQVWEIVSNLQSYKDTLSNLPSEALGNTGKELLSDIEDTINYVVKNLDGYTNIENMIDNIFAKSKFDGVKESLISAGKLGTDALNSLILSTPGLTDALNQAGVSAQELSEYIMALADPDSLNLNNVRKILEDNFVSNLDGLSEHVKMARQQIWNEFAGDKTDNEIEIFYRYVNDNNLDISDWTLEDLTVNLKRAVESAHAAIESIEPITFSSLFKDSEGNDTEFSKSVDTFQSDISSIQSSLDSLKNGETIDLTDLVQQFPELAGQTDNLNESLNNLKYDKLNEFTNTWKIAIADITDPSQIDSANQFFKNLIDGIDLSGIDASKVKKQINALFEPDTSDPRAEQVALRKIQQITSVFDKELQTENGREIIFKLAADTSMADATISEWINRYEEMFAEMNKLNFNDHPMLDAYNIAEKTENAGDRYLGMKAAFENAQKAYENGLVGTDDFKTAAALLSPNAMDDADNWQENYGKVLRYFTEDSEGVKNFLNDLSTKTNEAGEALATYNDETGEWAYNIEDVQAAADSMGISFEAFTAIMGRLQDYGFSNDFFGNVDEGTTHLSDLYSELSQAEIKLQELKDARAAGDNTVTDTVINAQEEKVQQIRSSIENTQSYLDQMLQRTASDYEAEAKSAENIGKSLIDQYNNTSNGSVRQMILDDLSGLENEYHIGIIYDNNGDPVEIVQQDINKAQETANNNPIEITETTIHKVEPGSPELPNIPSIQEVASETMSTLAVKYEVKNPDEPKEQIENNPATLPVEVETDNSSIPDEIDTTALFNSENAKGEVDSYSSYITDNVPDEIETVATFNIENAKSEISAFVNETLGIVPSEKTVDATFDVESAKAEISAFVNETLETVPETTDTTANAHTDEASNGFTNLIDLINSVPDANPSANLTDNATYGINNISIALDDLDGKTATTYIKTIHTTSGGNEASGGGGSFALGTAHSSGTAVLDMWSGYRHSIGAYANGTSQNWALPRDEEALVNETGEPESIVRDGRWFLIPGGAHVEQLKKGDIIFNHKYKL